MIYFHHHSPENTGRSSEKKSRHLYLARATGLSQLANSGSHSLEQVEFPAVKIVATALASVRAIRAPIQIPAKAGTGKSQEQSAYTAMGALMNGCGRIRRVRNLRT